MLQWNAWNSFPESLWLCLQCQNFTGDFGGEWVWFSLKSECANSVTVKEDLPYLYPTEQPKLNGIPQNSFIGLWTFQENCGFRQMVRPKKPHVSFSVRMKYIMIPLPKIEWNFFKWEQILARLKVRSSMSDQFVFFFYYQLLFLFVIFWSLNTISCARLTRVDFGQKQKISR